MENIVITELLNLIAENTSLKSKVLSLESLKTQYSTTDLTANSSPLTTGKLYIVYE